MSGELKLKQCCETVYSKTLGRCGCARSHQCTQTKNLVDRDGKLYCKQHDPMARERIFRAKIDRESVRRRAKYQGMAEDSHRREAFPLLVKACEMTKAYLLGGQSLADGDPQKLMDAVCAALDAARPKQAEKETGS